MQPYKQFSEDLSIVDANGSGRRRVQPKISTVSGLTESHFDLKSVYPAATNTMIKTHFAPSSSPQTAKLDRDPQSFSGEAELVTFDLASNEHHLNALR